MSSLNQQQSQAVNHLEGPLLVLAGAGSGKTRVVTHRIVKLLEIGVPASEILAVTFTNKAAEEMRSRIQQLSLKQILACTYHSLCARILRESISHLGYTSDFTIYDEDDTEKLLKECFKENNLKDEKSLLKETRSRISNCKNNLIDPDKLQGEDPLFSKLYEIYQKKLRQYNAIDFDDMLFLTVKLFRGFPEVLEKYQKRWQFVLIDEYQDTNMAQYMIAKLLVGKHNNIFVVGDPDQSIYSWRGANINNILDFSKDYPGAKVISLEQNYRSQNNILSAANALIKKNSGRYEKSLWSNLGPGDKIGLYIADTDQKEAEFVIEKITSFQKKGVPLREIAIFYRTNFQSRVFEDALLRFHIPYSILGGISFYQRREIKDVLALLRVALSGTDFLSFSRTVNIPKRGIGESCLQKIQSICSDLQLPLLEALDRIVHKKIDAKFSIKQVEGLRSYLETLFYLRNRIQAQAPISQILEDTLEKSRYLQYLQEDAETFEERRENVSELISKAHEWQEDFPTYSLSAFLEDLSLKSSSDTKESTEDRVCLMTLHNSKGLEFRVVFLVGMEEELFPHMNAKGSSEEIEEERRLCYVGMTRAKENLYLSASKIRFLWGATRMMQPSRFLQEIPKEYLQSLQRASFSYEPRERSSSEEFKVGEKALHKDFGIGVVQKVYSTSLGLTYDVFFQDEYQTRSLVAKYAKLMRP